MGPSGSISRLIFAIFLVLISETWCFYEDQIGTFDWKQSHVGKIKFGRFDSVKRLVVATEENVLASLYLKNGQIAWRQVLEESPANQIELLSVDSASNKVLTVSGDGNVWFIRSWDSNMGTLLFEWTLSFEGQGKHYWIESDGRLIHVLPVADSHLEVTTYDANTGQNSGKTKQILAPWIRDVSSCVTAGTYWSCISEDGGIQKLYYLDLFADDNVFAFELNSLIGTSEDVTISSMINEEKPSLLLTSKGRSKIVNLKLGEPEVLRYNLSPDVTMIPNGNENLLMQIEATTDDKLQIRKIELNDGTESVIPTECDADIGYTSIVAGICKSSACRLLVATEDHAVRFLQLPAGKVLWTREEALSNIVISEFVELPVSDLDASIEHEFDPTGDIFSTLYNRIMSQIKQIAVVVSGSKGTASNSLVQDEFGLHKLIVAYTSAGKLFALDSLNGNIVWSKFLRGTVKSSYAVLYVQRTARYSPWPALCTLLLKNEHGKAVMYTFDPISGHSETGLEHLPYSMKQAMLLPHEDDTHLKGILILTVHDELYLYPSSAERILLEHRNSLYMYTIDAVAGAIQGYGVMHSKENGLKATPVWNVNFGKVKIVATSARPSNERVHSQGRVLADRSVLYKYVNPNLVAVATLADDPVHKHVLGIHLIDAVTGLIVYSSVHRRACEPIYMIHSENWLAYTYFNERFRRVELATAEFYEGAVQTNGTAFSSHAVSQIPHVETQAYILPVNPVAMRVTLTERGITSKHVLLGTSNGAVVEIPWLFLEPRSALTPTGPEDAYIPYLPELPIPAESTLNYNQTLARIRDVQVAAARLESTCLMFVYGLDLFYTRVTPSKTFDLLKEDFDHWLIVVVLIGLVSASYVTKRLASRKALREAWK